MRGLVLGCLMLGWVSPWRAAAQSSADALELEWSAPDECGGEDRIRAALSQRLGERTVTRSEPVEASGTIERTPGGFALALVTNAGERRLEASRCDELIESAAVILALLIDPAVAPPEAEPEPEPESPEPPRAARPTVFGGYVRAEVLADLGLLPSLSVGPGLALGLRVFQTLIELSGTYLPTQHPEFGTMGQVGDLRLFSARLGACQMFADRPAFGPCIFAEYNRLTGSGGGSLGYTRDVDATVWVLLAAARLTVPLGTALAWTAELAAGLPTITARFTVDSQRAHDTGAVIGRVRTGLELRF